MAHEIENLPRLLQRAVSTLEKATSAAEILEAQGAAGIAYDAAKRLSKIKGAHDTVVQACRKAMADALVIESRAQCRLADEYDAAQEEGKLKKPGGSGANQTGIIPKKNNSSSAADVGLTSKQIHEARKVRDAEKEQPGMIRKAVDDRVEAGEEPTRADIKRAIKGEPTKPKRKRERQHKNAPEKKGDAAKLFLDDGLSRDAVKARTGLGLHEIQLAVERERGRREAEPIITPDMLSMTAQKKLDAAMRQYQKKLDAEFEDRVQEEFRKRVTSFLPWYENKIKEAQELGNAWKGLMSRAVFRRLQACLHPDRSMSDESLAQAFDYFTKLEKVLVNERDKTPWRPWPKTLDELDEMRTQQEARA